MESETGFPSSHQLKSYVAYKSHLPEIGGARCPVSERMLAFLFFVV